MCLNLDTQNVEELLAEIDGLIEELQELKSQLPERFAQWKQMHKFHSFRHCEPPKAARQSSAMSAALDCFVSYASSQ